MRHGNCCDRCKTGVWDEDKSYALASWKDYYDWCKRLGHNATMTGANRVIVITEGDGTVLRFNDKKALFNFIVGVDDV